MGVPPVQQGPQEGGQLAVVAGAQGGKGHLFIASGGAQILGVLLQRLPPLFPDGPVEEACLAEPASPGAAPHDLHHHSVVNDGGEGNHKFLGIKDLVQILHHGLGHHRRRPLGGAHLQQAAVLPIDRLVEGGHIHPLQAAGPAEILLLGPSGGLGLLHQVAEGQGHLLPFPQDEEIHKVGQGLRVAGTGASPDHQRRKGRAVLRPHRQPRLVQHLQKGGIAHLILQGKPNQVHLPDGGKALQPVQKDPGLGHLLGHVVFYGKNPLAPIVLPAVDEGVEDLHPQVGHPHLVQIGKAHGKPDRHLVPVLCHAVQLAAGIPARLLHPGQHPVQLLGNWNHVSTSMGCLARRTDENGRHAAGLSAEPLGLFVYDTLLCRPAQGWFSGFWPVIPPAGGKG